MADKKISQLTGASTPLAGTEVLPIVQGGATVKVAVSDLTAARAVNALSLALTSTDAGATAAPLLELYRDSASPAASDTLGEIEFNGEDSAGNKQAYGLIHASILSPTSTAEQGQIHFETATAGALTEKMIIGTTNLVINEIGAVYNVRIEGDGEANLFYTDATNDRIGVGTATPGYRLDVTRNGGGGDNAQIARITDSNTSNSLGPLHLTVGATNHFAGNPGMVLAGTNGIGLAVGDGSDLASQRKLTIDSSGNVGIGTTSATGKLEVVTGTTATAFNSNNSSNSGYVVKFASAYTAIGNNFSAPLVFLTGDTERARIDPSGIVTMNAYGAGAATFSAAGVISSVSDETWKIKDGVPVDPDSMLKKLEPGYWYYNDEKKEIFGVDRQLGFYAQNVNAAIGPEAAPQPEVVTTKAPDGTDIVTAKPWGYYDRSVLAITVMSLQKALATIESLTARIETLEAK